jgi:hypothetical protein
MRVFSRLRDEVIPPPVDTYRLTVGIVAVSVVLLIAAIVIPYALPPEPLTCPKPRSALLTLRTIRSAPVGSAIAAAALQRRAWTLTRSAAIEA